MSYFFIEKIKGRSGESIAETLVVLIAVALLMLAGTVNTSTNLVLKSQKLLSESESGYYEKNNAMEERNNTSMVQTETITISYDAEEMTEKIKLYKNDRFSNNPIFVYE